MSASLKRSPLGVSSHVERQMIGSAETSLAVAALEGFRSSMLAIVPGELVAAREPPLASFPGAFVRFLACMRPLVRLQVRTLRVNLLASEELAFVYMPFRSGRVV